VAVGTGTKPAIEVTPGALVGGRYELGPIIGRGGMSTVYRARDRRTGNDVAVKVFRPGIELADSPARRLREVQLASSVPHAGVVAVLDAQLDETGSGCAFLVTELVDGPTLSTRLRSTPLTEREMVGLAAALCSTLAAVHRVGIIHRDIKPANVLLPAGPDGLLRPKLADFGIAVMIDSTRMTATGFLAGTANYLSPEQVQGQALNPATDIYSLGLVLIESVRGVAVFGGSGIEAAVARLHAAPTVPSGLDPGLARLLSRMTDRTPANRPSAQSAAGQFQQLLGSGLATDIFAINAPPRTMPSPRQGVRRTKRWHLAVPIGGVVAAGAIGLLLANTNTADGRTPTSQPASAATTSTTSKTSDQRSTPSAVPGTSQTNAPVATTVNYPARTAPQVAAPITLPTTAAAVTTSNGASRDAGKPKKNNGHKHGNSDEAGDD
jgi:serine/threonine protein kinase